MAAATWTQWQQNPNFAELQAGLSDKSEEPVESVLAALRTELEEISQDYERQLTELQARPSAASYAELVERRDRVSQGLGKAWGLVHHLIAVADSDALRKIRDTFQPEYVEQSGQWAQDERWYAALLQLRQSPAWPELSGAQQRAIQQELLAAQQAGVGLPAESQQAVRQLKTSLAQLSSNFGNHVLDATAAWSMELTTAEEVAGLPAFLLEAAAQAARKAGNEAATAEAGPWRIGLDFAAAGAFLAHAQHRERREMLYRQLIARAGPGTEWDNSNIIEDLRRQRYDLAQALGYEDFAHMSLAKKMAGTPAAAEELLESLRAAAYPVAQQELADLTAYAAAHGQSEDVQPWDLAFWRERLREERFALREEAVRPYFPLPKVLRGLFALLEDLFGVQVVLDSSVDGWNESVEFYWFERDGVRIAGCYLDLYARPGSKRGGAWMNDCIGKSHLNPDVVPLAYLVCNQLPPVGEQPSLLSFREVETLFHEFGHGLQHMLTQVGDAAVAGISGVEWDAVELPSQFMEQFLSHPPVLASVSGHWQTNEPLPDAWSRQLLAAQTYMVGMDTLRQVHFALLDLRLHSGAPQQDAEAVRAELVPSTTVFAPLPEDRFLCSFSHIFAGGYAAGYFSYKWAEVLAADAFAAFTEADLNNDDERRRLGRLFGDTVLARGGAEHPSDVFRAFRGRDPDPQALLILHGLLPIVPNVPPATPESAGTA
jgi:oligopeptidase A